MGVLLTAALCSGTSFAAPPGSGVGTIDAAGLVGAVLGSLDSLQLRADDSLDWSLRPAAHETLRGALDDVLLHWSPASSPPPLAMDAASAPLSPPKLDLALASSAAPVSTRYDSHNDLLVDMSWWNAGDSSLRLLYGDHLQWQAAPNQTNQQVGLDLSLALGGGLFHARTERALGAPGSGDLSAGELTAVQYGYAANLGKVRYGADYVQAGSAYTKLFETDGPNPERNHATTTLWTRVPLTDRVSLQASAQQLRKDLDSAPDKPSYIDDLTGLKAHIVFMAEQPYVGSSLWFQEGLRSTQYLGEASAPGEGDVRNSGAALEVSNAWGRHSFTTTQAVAYNTSAGWIDHSISQSLSSTVYPYSWLTLGLAVTASEDSTRTGGSLWLGTDQSEMMWASYSPPERRVTLTWSGSAHGYSTLDGSTDYSQTYENFSVKFDKFSLLGATMPLALTLQFSTYADQVYSTQSTNDVALWLQFGRGKPTRMTWQSPYLALLPGAYPY